MIKCFLMTSTQVREKIRIIENELEVLKYAVAQEPDFDVDERNWENVKADVKRARRSIFTKTYGRARR